MAECGCCEVDAVLRSSLTTSDTFKCTSPGRSQQRCPNRTQRTGATVVEPIVSVAIGSQCWRQLVVHHRSSVFSRLRCHRLDRIQPATSLYIQKVIDSVHQNSSISAARSAMNKILPFTTDLWQYSHQVTSGPRTFKTETKTKISNFSIETSRHQDSSLENSKPVIIITTRCTLVQSAILRSHVVCRSVRL